MSELKLRDKEIFPTNEVLKSALGESFIAFEKLSNVLSENEIILDWNYYRDGNTWLCKMLNKKKNLGWIPVYDGFFRVSCYFLERHMEMIENLKIADTIKEEFYKTKPSGKLRAMSIVVSTSELPDDVLTMILFKKGLK